MAIVLPSPPSIPCLHAGSENRRKEEGKEEEGDEDTFGSIRMISYSVIFEIRSMEHVKGTHGKVSGEKEGKKEKKKKGKRGEKGERT